MELRSVVPWGRKLSEYQEMFSLNDIDLKRKILGCGDGPASFNRELTELGGNVVSIDPVYQFSEEQIRSRIDEAYPQVMSQMNKNKNDYIWETIANAVEFGQIRMKAMEKFLTDYSNGKEAGRYINASLPKLPFEDKEFDLALCSHYLFLYSEHVNQIQHILSVKELCRVAGEVRVYPLLSLNGLKSTHLEPVMSLLAKDGFDVSLQTVKYQFQKGATEMLVIKSI